MMPPTSEAIREAIASILSGHGEPHILIDDTNLLLEGLVDSLGFVELIAALEARFQLQIDLTELEPSQLAEVGALSRHVAHTLARRASSTLL